MGDTVYYIGQGVGAAALIIAMLSFQQRTQKKIVLYQLVSSVLFTVHFFMIGAYVGSLLNFIGIFRAAVFANKDKKWAQNKAWLFVFLFAFAAAGILTLDGDIDITTWNVSFASVSTYIAMLPVFGMSFTTVAFWITDAAAVRLVSFPSSPCWLTYNLYNRSWAGAGTEIILMTSIIVAMLRYDFKFIKKQTAEVKKL